MMKILKILLVVIGLLFVVYQIWVFTRPEPRSLSYEERGVVAMVCERAADAVVEKAGASGQSPVNVGVAHLLNDPSDEVTCALRKALAEEPTIEMRQGSVIQTFLKDVTHALSEATTLDEVLNASRRVDLDLVISGKVIHAEKLTPDTAEITLKLYVFDSQNGSWLMREEFTGKSEELLEQRELEHKRKVRVVCFWIAALLAICGFPWLLFRMVEKVLDNRSNAASLLFIVGVTLFDLLVIVGVGCFLGWSIGSLLWVLVLLVCGGYNFWACETMAKRMR